MAAQPVKADEKPKPERLFLGEFAIELRDVIEDERAHERPIPAFKAMVETLIREAAAARRAKREKP